MKFKCKMMEANAMRDFTTIVSAISRMVKCCVLRLTTDELYFSVGDEQTPILWAVLSQERFFTEYVMNGVSERENEIYLEFDASLFARGLNSLKVTAKSLKIKLTNKQQPCLTFDIDLSALSIDSRQCTHDVPVRLVPRKEWSEFKMPDIPDFDISLEMPQLKYLRHVADRMKNLCSRVTLTANKSGTLVFTIDINHATVSTHFKGLQVWKKREEEDGNISGTICIKKLIAFLGWDILHPDNVKCNMLQEKMIKLTLDVGDHIKIHYFIPAIIGD